MQLTDYLQSIVVVFSLLAAWFWMMSASLGLPFFAKAQTFTVESIQQDCIFSIQRERSRCNMRSNRGDCSGYALYYPAPLARFPRQQAARAKSGDSTERS